MEWGAITCTDTNLPASAADGRCTARCNRFLVVLGVIVAMYVGVAEIAKRIFYQRVNL